MDDKFLAIERTIPKKEIDALKSIIIFKEHDGSYNVYGKYIISKNTDGIFVVSVTGTHTIKYFYKLKNAVAWCSYDKRKLLNRARRLHQLDQSIFSMDTEIQIHSRLLKKSKDTEYQLIYLSKLTENKAKKRSFTTELSYFLDEYKRWQTTAFDTKPNY